MIETTPKEIPYAPVGVLAYLIDAISTTKELTKRHISDFLRPSIFSAPSSANDFASGFIHITVATSPAQAEKYLQLTPFDVT
mmetsp:Transcript_56332/g.168648  ORF Transcript_56332/g.168648 Transcript_56332/m.168648 type:complete len:82 (+) Transcript_56332:331-576(+)